MRGIASFCSDARNAIVVQHPVETSVRIRVTYPVGQRNGDPFRR